MTRQRGTVGTMTEAQWASYKTERGTVGPMQGISGHKREMEKYPER